MSHLHSVAFMKILRFSCLILLCSFSLGAQAIKVPGLYEVEVPVLDQSDKARREGLETAFRMVMIKLTGDRQAAGRRSLQPLMQRAQDYLQQYRYREVSKTVEIEGEEPLQVSETRLWLKFDEDNLNRALRNLGVPVWGNERPSTLVWLAVSDESGRYLTGLEEGGDYIEPIERRAKQRGIVLLYPLLDLDDSNNIRASDIWGGFQRPILQASSRYQADAVLTAAIEAPVPGIWEARWTAYIDNQQANWTSESDVLEAVLDEGVDRLADILAAQFASRAQIGESRQIRLSVADVFTLDQYARVLDYLSSLNSVADVEVVQVENGRVEFVLQAHGGELVVNQAIELGRVLDGIGANSNHYRLLP